MKRTGILAGGNWIVDHVKLIDTWPAQDSLASILGQGDGNGGSAYNMVKDLAILGAAFPLEAVGLVGDDADGRAILADCARLRIDTKQLRVRAGAATSYTDVMTVRGSGRRTFFHQRGANALLDTSDFDFTQTRAQHFHLGYLLLLDRLDELVGGKPRAAEVLARARAAGLTTSVDCVSEASERFQKHILPLLPEVDVLFANDFEAEKLTGFAINHGGKIDRAAVESAARRLIQQGVRQWALIHFPEAVCACAADGACVWQPSVAVPGDFIAGAAGAGDALAAGVMLGWLDRKPMQECLRQGVCAAAASLSHPSCSDGLKPLAECLALGQRFGYRT
ncbi:MAG: ribokinase [Opitutaceae bacterium]|nr:ribokinase [Opitutaceae bacterium]